MSILIKHPIECDEIYDRRFKRCRIMEDLENSIDALQQCPSSAAAEEVLAAATAASSTSSSGDRRRSSDCMDESPREPIEKRIRIDSGPSMLQRPEVTELGSSNAEGSSEASIHGWAETVVKTLQGCPSVDAAIQRSSRVLTDMVAEVRQATISEVELTSNEPPPPLQSEDVQELTRVKDMNRILMRGVRQLAERCKRLEGQGDEIATLRQALAQSQDAQRRLQHSNDVLQGHLRLSLDGRGSSLPWGSAVH